MYVEVERGNGAPVVRPVGELDVATAPELERVLKDLLDRHWAVVVDLGDVTFADCAGLRPIRWALGQPYLVSLRLPRVTPLMRRLLELTGLTEGSTQGFSEPGGA